MTIARTVSTALHDYHGRVTKTHVSDLDPSLQTLVVREDLHTRLCVRVVGGLEPQFVVASLLEESLHHRCGGAT